MGRKINRGGRAMIKSFSYPKEFDVAVVEIEEICRREGTSFSDLMVDLIKEYVREHSQSQNPQTKIDLFETGLESAIPNVYNIAKNPEIIKKFYQLVKRKKDYQELDKGINIWVNAHNQKLKEF